VDVTFAFIPNQGMQLIFVVDLSFAISSITRSGVDEEGGVNMMKFLAELDLLVDRIYQQREV
jgi:hypothetical protein